jgi:hypothetical protein
MDPTLVSFLTSLGSMLLEDLGPLIQKLIEGAAVGKSPEEVLADEDVAKIIPAQWHVIVTMAAQRAKYAPGA